MKELKNIVVGLDFSPACDQALIEAERIAIASDAALTALHVLDQDVVNRLNSNGTTTPSQITSAAAAGAAHVKGVLSPNHSAKLEFIVGDPFTEAQNTVANHHAELLVLGSGHDPGHIGAVASKCIRRSHCDVLLVRESQNGRFQKIVACVDFSPGSEKAVEKAYSMARQDGATLELLHVYPPIGKQIASRHYFISASPESLSKNDEIALEKIRKDLETLTETFADNGVECTNIILRQLDHKRAIIDYLNTSGADLVAMGKRGRTNLREMFLGTTAERVINHAQCSVLLVNT